MTKVKPKALGHLESVRRDLASLRLMLPEHEKDRVAFDDLTNKIEDEIDALDRLLRDVVCDANTTLDRIM